MNPDLATHTSVHLSGVCWFMATLIDLHANIERSRHRQTARVIFWRCGCLMLWVHILATWQLIHGGRWSAAWQQTADETAAVVGIRTGVGIWFNLLTLALWTGDCLLSLAGRRGIDSTSGPGHRWLEGYLAFMWFQAAVVFPRGPVRLAGSIAFLILLGVWWHGRRLSPPPSGDRQTVPVRKS